MGGFGAPDRGGSRESKNSSLRANKKNAAKALKDGDKPKVQRPTTSERPPAALAPDANDKMASIVDAGAQLGSRQFERDQQKVLQRAGACGVGPLLTYTTDDSKLEALVRSAKENAGSVYCMLGVHSDNIKRANDRLAPARLESLRDLALEGCCVAVMAGLAFRDVGIRYAQERALTEQMELAASIALPLVLYEARASEALVERIAEFRASGAGEGRAASTPIAIFNFTGSEEELRTYLGLGCYIVLTGRVCDQTEKGERLREFAATIPPDRLILASDSPFATPQNIDDVFMREGRNEPSNLPYVLAALAAALGVTEAALAASTRRNTLTFFGIREAAEAAAEAEAAEAAAAAAAGAAGEGPSVSAAAPAPATSTAKASASKGGKAAAGAAAAAAEEAEREAKPGKGGRRGKKGGRGGADSEGEEEEPVARGGGRRRGGSAAAAAPAGDADEEDEEDEEETGLALTKQRRNKAKKGRGKASGGGKAANAFAQLRLQEDEGEGEGASGSGAGQDEEGEEAEREAEQRQHQQEAEEGASQEEREAGASEDQEAEDQGRGASGGGASTSSPTAAAAAAAVSRARRPAPRNFVAEYEAAAAAKGPATGPRVSYSCRACRSVLFTEADTFPHQDHERAVFAATKPRNKKGRSKKGGDDGGDGLCSMHFLSQPLPWMTSCMQSEGGGRLGEGRLDCPTCSAKLGKWAAGPGSDGSGVACSCGVLVPAPAYAVLKARLDILDAQLDIASAVQSSLKAYEEEEEAGSASSSSSDDGSGTKKKRQKQKRNKTANFSSFRNKNFGFRLKDQKAIAETVATGAAGGGMGAVKEEAGEESD